MFLKASMASSLLTILTALAIGQTSADLSAKYTAVSAFEVRPGILITATYDEGGQVCRMTIEKRHSSPKEPNIDLGSNIPLKLIEQLADELVPPAERGAAKSKWLDPCSIVAGGVSDIQRSYENVSIEIVGDTSESCDGGNKVAIIRWTKRSCADSVALMKPSGR